MPRPPSTKIIQVNVASGATRIVRRIASPRGSNSAAMTRASSFADDPALYGWLLRRATSGWRRGAWQRRFFVLVPKSSCLLYFHRGLHTREVQLCRNADPSAPAARGTIPLANAMVCTDDVDGHKQHSFSIAVPGGFEDDLAAHSAAKKEASLDQLVRDERGDDLQPAPPPVPVRPAGGVVRATTGATLPLGAARRRAAVGVRRRLHWRPVRRAGEPLRVDQPASSDPSATTSSPARAPARRAGRPHNYLQTPSRAAEPIYIIDDGARPLPLGRRRVGPRAREDPATTERPLRRPRPRARAGPARRLERLLRAGGFGRGLRGVCRR